MTTAAPGFKPGMKPMVLETEDFKQAEALAAAATRMEEARPISETI